MNFRKKETGKWKTMESLKFLLIVTLVIQAFIPIMGQAYTKNTNSFNMIIEESESEDAPITHPTDDDYLDIPDDMNDDYIADDDVDVILVDEGEEDEEDEKTPDRDQDLETALEEADMDQVVQDLNDTGITFIDGWVLFDSQLNRLPQPRSFQGAIRNVGGLPSATHDLRHVSNVWTTPWQMHRYEAFVNGRWVAAFCIQPGVPTVGDGNANPGWSQGLDGLSTSQRATVQRILLHGYDNIHGFNIPAGDNATRRNAYVATQVLIWEAALGFWNVNTPWNGNSSIPAGVQGDPWRRLISDSGQMIGGDSSSVTINTELGGTSTFNPRPAIGNGQRMSMYAQIRSDIWTFHGQTPIANRTPVFASTAPSSQSPLHTLMWDSNNGRYQVRLSDSSPTGNAVLNRFINLDIGESRSFGSGSGLRVTRESANVIYVYATSAVPNTDIHSSPTWLLDISSQNSLPVMFWTHPTLQDKATGNASDSLQAFFRVQVQSRVRGGIQLQKNDSDRNTNIPQGEATLQGATIEIINRSGWTVVTLDGREIADGAVFGTMTVNANGIARTAADFLQEGKYELREVASPRGYLLNEEWSYTFEVGEELVTHSATDSLPQDIIRGGVEVEKADRELTRSEILNHFTGRNPVQGDATLVGIQFDIRNISTPAAGSLPDGAVIVDGELFQTGDVVYSIFTDYEVRNGELRVFARTAADLLPFGTFEIQEVVTNDSYLLTDGEPRSFEIREDGTIVTGTIEGDELTFFNYVVRGDVEIQKWDVELDASEAMAGTSLEDIEFAITNRSSNPVLVDGDIFEPDEVILSIFSFWCENTDAYVARTTGRTLPYGTYEITEIRSNTYYLLEEELGRPALSFTFAIRKDGQVVRHATSGSEMIFRNQVRRGDLAGVKIGEGTAERLSHIPFAITNQVSGETNVIVTDDNGEFNTIHTWNPRSNANINNHLLEMEEKGDLIMNSDVDMFGSVWFATGEFGSDASVHRTLGALTYGWYTVREMRAENNVGFELLEFDVFISRHGHVINLGTLTNINEPEPECPFDPDDPTDPNHPDHPDSPYDWDDWSECPRPEPEEPEKPEKKASILTQAWTGTYGNQYFWWGDDLYMTDTVRIRLYNIEPSTLMRFNASLHNRTVEGVTTLVYTSDYYEFEVPYVEGWQTGEVIELEFEITTSIPIITGDFERDSEFFWSENLYEQIVTDNDSEKDDEWDLIYEHNPEGDDPKQTLFPRYATIATQAHTGDGTQQTFLVGTPIYAHDIIRITHGNIPDGTQMYYSIYLFAVPNNINMGDVDEVMENKILIWYDLHIPYTVDKVVMTFEEMTNVDTSEWYGYTLFFAERLYRSSFESDDDEKGLVYEHNKDGSCLNQRLAPVEKAPTPPTPTAPSQPILRPHLPQTGTAVFNVILGGVGLISGATAIVIYKRRKGRKVGKNKLK